MPKSYLKEEEKVGLDPNGILLAESAAADDAGDEKAAWEWLTLAELPAHSLSFLERSFGTEWMKKMGFKTARAGLRPR